MKKCLILISLLLTIPAVAAVRMMMPLKAQFCGNQIVTTAQKKFYAKRIQIEGCPEVVWVQVEDDHWLGYGVKVVIDY